MNHGFRQNRAAMVQAVTVAEVVTEVAVEALALHGIHRRRMIVILTKSICTGFIQWEVVRYHCRRIN